MSFDSKFNHVKGPTTTGAQASGGTTDGAAVDDDAALDFFSPAGMAAGAGSAQEQEYVLDPSEVHNYFKDFLGNNYHFASAVNVQSFVRIIASVNDRNPAWVSDVVVTTCAYSQIAQQNTDNAQEFSKLLSGCVVFD